MEEQEKEKFRKACLLVERFARSLGKECDICFADDGVSVAPCFMGW